MYKRFEYNHRNDTRKKTRIHAYKKRSGKAHFQMLFWESPFPAAMFPRNWRLQRRAERNPENILTRIQSNTKKFHKNYILQYSRYTLQNPSPGSFRCSISLLLHINICIFSSNANHFMKHFRITPKTCLSITHWLLVTTRTIWQGLAPHIIFWLAGQIIIDYYDVLNSFYSRISIQEKWKPALQIGLPPFLTLNLIWPISALTPKDLF